MGRIFSSFLLFAARRVAMNGYLLILLLLYRCLYLDAFHPHFIKSKSYQNGILVPNMRLGIKSQNDSSSEPKINPNENPELLSRRDLLWKAPIGAVGAYAYGRLFYNSLAVQGIQYPEAHERRTKDIISTALTAAASSLVSEPAISSAGSQPLRILEVGIGKDCRLIRRGLYDNAIRDTAENLAGRTIELTGVDFRLPNEKVILASQRKLSELKEETQVSSIDFQTFDGSITSRLPWEDGHFDSIICCLTLCSVDEADKAVKEMKRLLRPSGGTLGYVEHVAVDGNELDSHRFLEFQQRLLDPLQQRLADNCHLHRYNEKTLADGFDLNIGGARLLRQERFFVESMWPVSCQCCGVIQTV